MTDPLMKTTPGRFAGPLWVAHTCPEMVAPDEGFVVFFVETEYEIDGLRYFLSTQLRIAGRAKGAATGAN